MRGQVVVRVAGMWPLAALVGALLVAARCSQGREEASGDARTPVALNAEQRLAVLAEMRTMMGSVNGVLAATARWDTAGVRAAALASGSAAAADPALEEILPARWLAIATRTHTGFDTLAARVAAGANRDTVVAGLARITPDCVSCHAMYRLP